MNQVNTYIQQIESELEAERSRSQQLMKGQASLFSIEDQENLIRWQLDLKEDLDRIYHLLKGDRIVRDEEGNIDYQEAEDNNLKPFNEFGVQLIMNILQFYLNRNTILSNYSEDVINWKVLDFGRRLTDLIFNRYEEMGMDTPEKIKMFPMIVGQIVDTVHSAYLRAYHGGERESLRTARTVTQSEPLISQGYNQFQPKIQNNKRWYNPFTWAR